ncbi:hypothetical protein O7635_14425 [Asanoa sp. WMMD1127]|uniref:hypothetical protein n=1 Tax=Asanoa sp. WMMD1127 TaxID=3016107 RepID=UPI002416FF44|nr:hypothetical protein [Asanoa sp. WMMD1127]MDG4823047.1 hypothetical protein [Asanoa sp. WMMD1127]
MNRSGKAALWVAAAHAALLALACAGTFALPDHNPDGQCEGIGFGCVPAPRDSARLLIAMFGVPALLISLVVCLAVVAVVARCRARPGGRLTVARPVDSRVDRQDRP